MKLFKIALLLFLCVAMQPLWALRPGQRAAQLMPMQWLKGSAVLLDPDDEAPEFRVAVFLMTRALDADQTMRQLEQIARREGKKIRIAVVSPDNEMDCKKFLDRYPDTRLDFGRDKERRVTPLYMAGSLLYPMAFLINRGGEILWCGEAADLAEAIARAREGSLDVDIQKKIAPLIDELQQLMRDGSEHPMQGVAARIFELDPGQPTALRIRLFLLENSAEPGKAWELVREQQQKAPNLTRLYFTGLDLMLRHAEMRGNLADWTKEFLLHKKKNPESIATYAASVLNGFRYDAHAVRIAAEMLNRPEMALEKIDPAQQPFVCGTLALLQYQLGNPEKALAFQQQATKLLRDQEQKDAVEFSAAREAFFREILKLRGEQK